MNFKRGLMPYVFSGVLVVLMAMLTLSGCGLSLRDRLTASPSVEKESSASEQGEPNASGTLQSGGGAELWFAALSDQDQKNLAIILNHAALRNTPPLPVTLSDILHYPKGRLAGKTEKTDEGTFKIVIGSLPTFAPYDDPTGNWGDGAEKLLKEEASQKVNELYVRFLVAQTMESFPRPSDIFAPLPNPPASGVDASYRAALISRVEIAKKEWEEKAKRMFNNIESLNSLAENNDKVSYFRGGRSYAVEKLYAWGDSATLKAHMDRVKEFYIQTLYSKIDGMPEQLKNPETEQAIISEVDALVQASR
ncbi:MAG: hypothetical protein BSOLF_1773 [Candidatus Carbobacillus altaicus]|uniref:Lipoprotein n=1 Tax=Candidatus Carbonibacillus altaicus TaxID=2163959 RepID=A0A2R6XYW6_9BACL|nr:MAG: hypothetical protein BSOLF_1773 [Candidatus Carbobacillus altaicus]